MVALAMLGCTVALVLVGQAFGVPDSVGIPGAIAAVLAVFRDIL